MIYPGTHYFVARQEGIDLRKFTIPTINEVFTNWGLKIDDYAKYNGQDSYYTFYNGSKVFLLACKELPSDPLYERFGSMQMTRGWIEEGGEVSEPAKEALWISIGRWKNKEYGLKKKMLITANPKKGWMKRDFVDMAVKGFLSLSKKYIQAFATDNPYLTKDYLKTLSEQKNQVARQRLWEGNWDYDEDQNSLISFDALSDAFSNTITKDNQKYMVVDVARLGKDNTVFSFWDGLELYKVEKYEKIDTAKTTQKAKDFASQERIPYSNIIIDADGIGGAVVDNMQGVNGFVAESSPLPTRTEIRLKARQILSPLIPKTKYASLKSQCGFKLAEMINEHKLALKVPEYREEIIEELSALLRDKEVDGEGKKRLVAKDDVKKDISRSPDIGDTIIYRIWFELRKEATDETDENEPVNQSLIDQFAKNEAEFKSQSNK